MGVEVEEEIRDIKFGRQLEVSAQEITLKKKDQQKMGCHIHQGLEKYMG